MATKPKRPIRRSRCLRSVIIYRRDASAPVTARRQEQVKSVNTYFTDVATNVCQKDVLVTELCNLGDLYSHERKGYRKRDYCAENQARARARLSFVRLTIKELYRQHPEPDRGIHELIELVPIEH